MEKKPKVQYIQPNERVYIDPNLPIKLLFLINAVPLQDILADHIAKIPFAGGNVSIVGEKI